ncbi:MAG: hypothetical protein EZS28_002696 [Streblomastix strix]|uniref:Uncharacterized protein n=1 Tax=Streblomastix strix TaxID=222440 RepID=A0A5J4X3G3_9EUKA|nr:MAG: hypothetical protein EZS28_002696 [Streblomastix strix]
MTTNEDIQHKMKQAQLALQLSPKVSPITLMQDIKGQGPESSNTTTPTSMIFSSHQSTSPSSQSLQHSPTTQSNQMSPMTKYKQSSAFTSSSSTSSSSTYSIQAQQNTLQSSHQVGTQQSPHNINPLSIASNNTPKIQEQDTSKIEQNYNLQLSSIILFQGDSLRSMDVNEQQQYAKQYEEKKDKIGIEDLDNKDQEKEQTEVRSLRKKKSVKRINQKQNNNDSVINSSNREGGLDSIWSISEEQEQISSDQQQEANLVNQEQLLQDEMRFKQSNDYQSEYQQEQEYAGGMPLNDSVNTSSNQQISNSCCIIL